MSAGRQSHNFYATNLGGAVLGRFTGIVGNPGLDVSSAAL
jgi:hypothetical protein